MASHDSIGISSSACGHPACAPAIVVVDQQFIQLATARIPFRSCKQILIIPVDHQRVMDVFKHVSAIHVLHICFTSCPCPSSLARDLLPASCHIFGCSGARRTGTVQLLSGLILARCMTSPQPPPGSHLPRFAEFRAEERELALWC